MRCATGVSSDPYIHRLHFVKDLYAHSIDMEQVSACLLAWTKEEHEQSLQSLWKLILWLLCWHICQGQQLF